MRHNDFIARCKDELDEGDYEIFVIAPPERGGRSFEAIRMTAGCAPSLLGCVKLLRRAIHHLKALPSVEHADFMRKCIDVLGETSHLFECDLPDAYGRSRRGYRFLKRENWVA